MKAAEIREKFLKFFESKGHTIVRSSSLVPSNDPTLLFTNSGMVQFKDVFLSTETRPYSRAVTSQPSLRAGGKHNDLENVGYTTRHHTFFEMLGNFSFGDYFKRDAIHYAWELLTRVYKLLPERLTVTVYYEDDEAYHIWSHEIGLPLDRIIRIGDNKGSRYASDNFWQMADTGPCGPCSEIFYDHGPQLYGGPPGSTDESGDRFIEIWNLVFTQFNRDVKGNLEPLIQQCVDTGMGLERLAAALQHVHSNYEIDLFQQLIAAAARATGISDLQHNSLKVIADHIRACSFMIVDGVVPGNDGRDYVLRRIVRRAIRHGYKLGCKRPFFYKLVEDLIHEMGNAYPELKTARRRITDVLHQEEERFSKTIEQGMLILEAMLSELEVRGVKIFDGELAFKLHDTYGFPLDLTADVCRERGINIDEVVFSESMKRQREKARTTSKFQVAQELDYRGVKTIFHGYDQHICNDASVVALYINDTVASLLQAGHKGIVVLDRTPFYAEAGGQVGDQGALINSTTRFTVSDTFTVRANVVGHQGILEKGELKVGDVISACIDVERRVRTTRNHSATHLMHKALREVLGLHVQQKGSLVSPEKTRFDFLHNKPLSDAEIHSIEVLVNAEVLANTPSIAQVMSFDNAVNLGATALFGEKYVDEVRVIDLGFSRELCGGTHVQRTGDIGLFKIVFEGSVAANIRRIEAITGDSAVHYVHSLEAILSGAARVLKVQPIELTPRVMQIWDQLRVLKKELVQIQLKLATSSRNELLSKTVDVSGVHVLAAEVESTNIKMLREIVDRLKDTLSHSVIVLATVSSGKISLIASVTTSVSKNIHASELVNFVARQVDGKGGGGAYIAQAGGTNMSKLPEALLSVKEWVQAQL
ncbi:alanine--tRNA ligase [Candidatus Vallotia tarda]|uniref:Alanine--tRNA ligase n=1 Tax=Candidatus Vallotiella hemipterorum TaxID=1177213 RepID=A0A916JSH4_9BURK|nr:alanine--tRNA ligase [Candidatus Vallotia tarda]CAG7598993.1 Alanine--tRNA ligase [Candidatus Vallotia tarda]